MWADMYGAVLYCSPPPPPPPLPAGLIPHELYLHLDVAVYYFFLQLYALFPCNLSTYLRGRYGPTGEVYEFQEYIAVSHLVVHPSSKMAVCMTFAGTLREECL